MSDDANKQPGIPKAIRQEAPLYAVALAVLSLVIQQAFGGRPSVIVPETSDVPVLKQRVTALESAMIELGTQTRRDSSEMMKILTELRVSIGKIESKLESKP